MLSVSVCVPVYRVHSVPNIASVASSMPAALAGMNGQLVVALNGVDAKSADVPSDAVVVDLGVNRGVAPGWNAAARASSGDVLVFCNDDVDLGVGSIARLVSAMQEQPDAGVVGPAGSQWDIVEGRHLADVTAEGPGELAACDVVSGFLFACHRRTWDAVGGFDEFYAPASWEEVDFCTAVRAAGSRCYVVGGLSYGHEWGVSRRQWPWARASWDGRSETWRSIHRRNRRHFVKKWAHDPIAQVPTA